MQKVIITGADSGLGMETARCLLKDDYYVIMACRDLDKAGKARDMLIKDTGSSNVVVQKLDLRSLASVRAFVASIDADIYGLICNAGVQNSKQLLFTEDNIEQTFGVNYLAHFLLVNLMLKKSGNLKRIAMVTSSLHDPAIGGPQPPRFESVELMAHPPDISEKGKPGFRRYATSKLCMVFFTYRLAELLKANYRTDVLVNAFNPGLMAGTALGRNSTFFTGLVWYYLLPVLARTVIKGASTPERSAEYLSRMVTDIDVTGKYFDIDKERRSSTESYDMVKAMSLWDESEQICGMTTGEKWYQKTA
jgi:NAD(P)-dependent dehydrogenase (short-subunit alcohol dehydrogenase family)